MATFLLALDQATQSTGFAVFKDEQLMTQGTKVTTGKDYIVKINQLRQWVEEIIDSVSGDIEIAIEDIQLQDLKGNTGLMTYKKLAHLQGALLSLFAAKDIKYYVVPPATWRHTCQIKGNHRNQQKANAQKYVSDTFGFEVDSDTADAICIGQHIIINNQNLNWS